MAFEVISSSNVGSPKNDLRKTLTVTTGVTSDWISFGSGIAQVNVDLLPGGTAKIQTTNDIDGLNSDPSSVVGIDWDDGEVSAALTRVASGVVAFRVVSITGVATAHFNAVRA